MRNMATRPRVTFALIAINVIAFLSEQGQLTISGSSIHGPVIEEGVLARMLTVVGGQGELVTRFPISGEHQYWRLLTSGFLHENLLHIGFNMYLLYLLGMMLEPALGSIKFAAIYFTSLLAGSFGALFATGAPSLGASGAIFGSDGGRGDRAQGPSFERHGVGHRRADHHQPDLFLHVRQHLGRRSYRRADRRYTRRPCDPDRRRSPPLVARSGGLRRPLGGIGSRGYLSRGFDGVRDRLMR